MSDLYKCPDFYKYLQKTNEDFVFCITGIKQFGI